jgi:hypothetical protein
MLETGRARGEGTDQSLILDAAVSFQPYRDLRLVLQERNLGEAIYVVARRPTGARPTDHDAFCRASTGGSEGVESRNYCSWSRANRRFPTLTR